jgi:hypothetical protein
MSDIKTLFPMRTMGGLYSRAKARFRIGTRTLSIVLIAAIIALVACAAVLARHGRSAQASTRPMPYLSGGPERQLTLARTSEDIVNILGAQPDTARMDAIEAAIHIDTGWFIPLYVTVLILVIVITGRGHAHVPAAIKIGLCVLVGGAALADVLENRAVLDVIGQARQPGQTGIAADFWLYAAVKWSFLAFVFAGLGAMNLLQDAPWRRIGGVIMLGLGVSFSIELLMYAADRLDFDDAPEQMVREAPNT